MNWKQVRRGKLRTSSLKEEPLIGEKMSALEPPLPEIFEIEPTNSCNLKCIMCHVSFLRNDQSENFNLNLLQKLTSLRGRWVVIGSSFEPCMHPQFGRFLQSLSEMDCPIDLTTNGTLLKKSLSDALSCCNIKNVTISFDGNRKETFEQIRRRGRFELALERILYFREALKPRGAYFAVNSVLMRRNIDELIEMINFWNSHDFFQLRLIFMVIRFLEKDLQGENNLVDESLYPIREYAFAKLEEAARYIMTNRIKITLSCPYFNQSLVGRTHPRNVLGNVVMSDNPASRIYFNPRHHFQVGKYPGMNVDCRSPFTFARILYNGDVQLCYKYTIGNLNDQDFEEIWYGKAAKRIRQMVMAKPAICHACDFYRFCLRSDQIDLSEKSNYFEESLVRKSGEVKFGISHP